MHYQTGRDFTIGCISQNSDQLLTQKHQKQDEKDRKLALECLADQISNNNHAEITYTKLVFLIESL